MFASCKDAIRFIFLACICWKARLSKVNRWSEDLGWILWYCYSINNKITPREGQNVAGGSVIQTMPPVRHFVGKSHVKNSSCECHSAGFYKCMHVIHCNTWLSNTLAPVVLFPFCGCVLDYKYNNISWSPAKTLNTEWHTLFPAIIDILCFVFQLKYLSPTVALWILARGSAICRRSDTPVNHRNSNSHLQDSGFLQRIDKISWVLQFSNLTAPNWRWRREEKVVYNHVWILFCLPVTDTRCIILKLCLLLL